MIPMAQRYESELLEPVRSFVRQRGYCEQFTELPFYEHRIDLYGYSSETETTLAVELKLRNWRRALKQAILYQLCADVVFLALPQDANSRIEQELLVEHGIGLILVDPLGDCIEVVKASKSKVLLKHYKKEYISLLIRGWVYDE